MEKPKNEGLNVLEKLLSDALSLGFHSGLTREVNKDLHRAEMSRAFSEALARPVRLSLRQQHSLQRLMTQEYEKAYWQDGHGSTAEAWFNAFLRFLEAEYNAKTDLDNIQKLRYCSKKGYGGAKNSE